VEETTKNALFTLDYFDANNIPVVMGCHDPLDSKFETDNFM
jgi:inosine-uridine nucleoside N-ribohydrolase